MNCQGAVVSIVEIIKLDIHFFIEADWIIPLGSFTRVSNSTRSLLRVI